MIELGLAFMVLYARVGLFWALALMALLGLTGAARGLSDRVRRS